MVDSVLEIWGTEMVTVVDEWFIFKDTEPSPLQDSFSVRQQGGLPGPPPRSPRSRIHRRPVTPDTEGVALLRIEKEKA